MNYKIGMRLSPNIAKQGLEEATQWAAKVGLDVIDLPYINKEVKEICKNIGLEIGSIDGVGAVGKTKLLSVDKKTRDAAVDKVKNQMVEMSEFGAKVMFMCLIPEDINMTREESFNLWKETFPEIVRSAEENGIFIALEGYPGPAPQYPTIGCTPEMLRAMIKEIPSKHFGFNYDPSHLVRLGIDYLRFLTEFGEYVNYCHGKDAEILTDDLYEFGHLPSTFGHKYDFSEGSWRYTIPGQGEVNWGKVAIRLEKVGYRGPVSIELEDHRYWGSLESERQGIIKAKEHLEIFFK
ncbi:sugar phosphate isomerase/epimerase family protein [Aquibacillus salsiterrae]|uniref:Sugar phosphate isomerase/epimerase n=1 Tax=Aquibacillus salsiterrae TaxID=2950439 RepID=A0A9X3WC18_9BACI|nr:sugar phosphate isomerase/epimerase [Aquibacillus salsiterrae]MDC3416622.1 sugar phosphate isomerase/epimerase [Aquibacillus salsiterrae]